MFCWICFASLSNLWREKSMFNKHFLQNKKSDSAYKMSYATGYGYKNVSFHQHKLTSGLLSFYLKNCWIGIQNKQRFWDTAILYFIIMANWSTTKRRIRIGPLAVRFLQYGPLRWTAHELVSPNCFFKKTVLYCLQGFSGFSNFMKRSKLSKTLFGHFGLENSV